LWSNGWMDQDVTWYEGRPRPGDIVLDGDPAPLKGVQPSPPPIFGPAMSIVAKRSPISATAELLSYYILAALLQGTRAVGVSQTAAFSNQHRAPPIFGRAAISLGIGPHSSFVYNAISLTYLH